MARRLSAAHIAALKRRHYVRDSRGRFAEVPDTVSSAKKLTRKARRKSTRPRTRGKQRQKQRSLAAPKATPKYQFKNDYHKGNGVLVAHHPSNGDKVGHLMYYTYEDDNGQPIIMLNGINTEDKYKRQGVAISMLRKLHQEFPKHWVNFGPRSDDGDALYNAVRKRPEFAEYVMVSPKDLKSNLRGEGVGPPQPLGAPRALPPEWRRIKGTNARDDGLRLWAYKKAALESGQKITNVEFYKQADKLHRAYRKRHPNDNNFATKSNIANAALRHELEETGQIRYLRWPDDKDGPWSTERIVDANGDVISKTKRPKAEPEAKQEIGTKPIDFELVITGDEIEYAGARWRISDKLDDGVAVENISINKQGARLANLTTKDFIYKSDFDAGEVRLVTGPQQFMFSGPRKYQPREFNNKTRELIETMFDRYPKESFTVNLPDDPVNREIALLKIDDKRKENVTVDIWKLLKEQYPEIRWGGDGSQRDYTERDIRRAYRLGLRHEQMEQVAVTINNQLSTYPWIELAEVSFETRPRGMDAAGMVWFNDKGQLHMAINPENPHQVRVTTHELGHVAVLSGPDEGFTSLWNAEANYEVLGAVVKAFLDEKGSPNSDDFEDEFNKWISDDYPNTGLTNYSFLRASLHEQHAKLAEKNRYAINHHESLADSWEEVHVQAFLESDSPQARMVPVRQHYWHNSNGYSLKPKATAAQRALANLIIRKSQVSAQEHFSQNRSKSVYAPEILPNVPEGVLPKPGTQKDSDKNEVAV